MLDLIFFTAGTSESDKQKIRDLYKKIMKSVWYNEMLGKTIFYDNTKKDGREFRILIEDSNPYNLHLEIDIDTIYERRNEDDKK